MSWTIYIHTCVVTGKRYVGQTKQRPEKRWIQHVSRARTKTDRDDGGCRVFHAAIRKYGPEAFGMEILDVVFTQEDADRVEAVRIAEHKTAVPCGYNLSLGGGPHDVSDETRRLQSERAKARWLNVPVEKRSEMAAARMSMFTAEQRSEIARKRWAGTSPEDRSEFARKRAAAKTPEQRSASARSRQTLAPHELSVIAVERQAALGAYRRSEIARKRMAAMTPERRSEIALKAAAAQTPEQRSESARLRWRNRRAKAAATP